MKDKKRIEILLKVIERIYNKNSKVDVQINDRCMQRRGCVTQAGIFYFASLNCCLYRNGLSKHIFFVCEKKEPMKNLGFNFSGDQGKASCILFMSVYF